MNITTWMGRFKQEKKIEIEELSPLKQIRVNLETLITLLLIATAMSILFVLAEVGFVIWMFVK